MTCPDCDGVGRRTFLKTTAFGAAGVAAARAASRFTGPSETVVTALYNSLSPEQKAKVAFPFDHPLRSKVDANWHITPMKIGEFFTAEQQAMIEEIFKGLHNPEFLDKVMYHMQEDDGGLGNYSTALFGTPGTGKFEFVLTGRHCTSRCDGDSVEGVAFGGPIFYGHASMNFNEAPDHPKNVYWYQAKRANQVFQALDGKQREMALLGDPREEKASETVALKKKGDPIPGLPVSDMSRDQRELVDKVLADLLMPFRKKDTDEAMKFIRESGGVEALTMSFYKNMDIGNDGVWDVWQLESPNMVWYFRGAPHVHTWVNIRRG
ncbi:MAG TPA: DUF3500 domain-containing protein [Bryobacteraceae bacterium]|nr:DUF3500 domain-containing protein [Bryobacteraceae bacterium]